MTERVELIPAHVWTCPECGTDHFERCVTAELPPDEREALRDEMGIEPWEDGIFLTAPLTVACPDCKRVYGTLEFDPSVRIDEC